MIYLKSFVALCAAGIVSGAAAIELFPGEDGVIDDGKSCASVMGAGGNLLTSASRLAGKCEGAVTPPRIIKSPEASIDNEIAFSVLGESKGQRDRTELAFTERRSRFLFGREYRVSMEVLLPTDVDATNNFFYIVQFWQGEAKPPIAGLRIDRGEARKASFIARGEGASPKGHKVAAVDLPPNRWVQLALKLRLNEDSQGCVSVTVNNQAPSDWCGAIGYRPGLGIMPWYRLKFGIYKAHEAKKKFRVSIRKLQIQRQEE